MPRVGSQGTLAQPTAEPQADEQATRSLLVSGVNSNHSEDELKQLFSVRPPAARRSGRAMSPWPMSARPAASRAAFRGQVNAGALSQPPPKAVPRRQGIYIVLVLRRSICLFQERL